jgi:hypothetical protein
MIRILSFLVVLGFFAGAIALVFAFWPFFVGMAVFSALMLAYFQWRKGAPARDEARRVREWSEFVARSQEFGGIDEARAERARRLSELEARDRGAQGGGQVS